MDYNTVTKPRFKEMRPGADGKLMTEWQLTDTKLTDTVKLILPPPHAVPIIFIPGIMGSNLSNSENKPIWLLDSVKTVPVGLAFSFLRKNAGERQRLLHPARTRVYNGGAVPKENAVLGLTQQDFVSRGWGEISQASYQSFLVWLDTKMNASRDPMAWNDFSPQNGKVNDDPTAYLKKDLLPGIVMNMHGLPEMAEPGVKVELIRSDELIKRSKSTYPVYAFGYNWLDTNLAAAESLAKKIKSVIKENNKGPVKCTQVILVTHSMGGLVARACCEIEGMKQKIVGVVHGVMPATGAAVAYRRCKVGMWDEDPGAALVIGSDGKEVTAVFAQSPGALQLLPSEDYGTNWLQIADPSGNSITNFPTKDPYEEIYLQRGRWWSLIREEWLAPHDGVAIKWDIYARNIDLASDFHKNIAGKYHHNTYIFYGGGKQKKSFEKIIWKLKSGSHPKGENKVPTYSEVVNFGNSAIRTDGSNNLYVGGASGITTSTRGDSSNAHYHESSFWEIRCTKWNSEGDGTVPSKSGRVPRSAGGKSILQQFELAGVEHEPAYESYPVARVVTYYAITKLAALADRS